MIRTIILLLFFQTFCHFFLLTAIECSPKHGNGVPRREQVAHAQRTVLAQRALDALVVPAQGNAVTDDISACIMTKHETKE